VIDYSIFYKEDKSGLYSKEFYIKKNYPEIYNNIINFANKHNLQNLKFSQKIWHAINNIPNIPTCENENCNNDSIFINRNKGYRQYCSTKCARSSKKSIEKRVKSFKKNIDQYKETYKKTCLKRYGTEHPWKNKDIHQKSFDTYKEKTGYSNPAQDPSIKKKIKETNLKRYNVTAPLQNKNIQEKVKQTNLERYGVENVYQSEKIKEKIKQTNLERYGVEYPVQSKEIQYKTKQTNLERYGVKYPVQCGEFKEKTKQTNLTKYGTEYPTQSKEVQEKTKQTNLERYGVENVYQSKEVKEKIKQTNLKRYGVEYYNQSNEYKEKIIKNWTQTQQKRFNNYNIISFNYDEKTITLKCSKCNKTYTINWRLAYYRNKSNRDVCIYCNPFVNYTSNFHNEICEFLDELNIKYIKNDRNIISPKELDIHIPDYNIAIEANGIYWHSELYKDKFYHQNKLNSTYEKGVRLIQIWEDDWKFKQDIIKHRLKIILNKENILYARKCKIKELNSKEYKEFLNKYHLQGYIATKVKLGLFYNNELMSVIGFGSLRKSMNQHSIENEFELYRFAEKYHIVGGLAKLFKHFIKQYNPTKIITYQDLDWGYSNLYEKLNFELEKITDPGYSYFKDEIRENRFKYRKDQLIKEGFNKNKTEHEIMIERGYYKIYNSGNLKWIYKKQ